METFIAFIKIGDCMEVEVGGFYYYEELLCELLSIGEDDIDDDRNILIGLSGDNGQWGVELIKLKDRCVWEYHKDVDLKHYTQFSYFPKDRCKYYLTPAFRKVKSTKLSRKVYPNPFKVEGDYLYVKF